MNNGSYINILFFPLALPRANDIDVESFVALFLFLCFFVLFLDVFFFIFLILLFIIRAATHALYKMNNERVSFPSFRLQVLRASLNLDPNLLHFSSAQTLTANRSSFSKITG